MKLEIGKNNWQPIETARKDRKSILVWCPENKCQYMVTWNDEWIVFGTFTKLERLPTHWRELPLSPEDEPKQPLRWVENTKPDKPGIWATQTRLGTDLYCLTEKDWPIMSHATRCYLGPIPEILPPVKKVTERLWLEATAVPSISGTRCYLEHWLLDDDDSTFPHWIRTDRTRTREC